MKIYFNKYLNQLLKFAHIRIFNIFFSDVWEYDRQLLIQQIKSGLLQELTKIYLLNVAFALWKQFSNYLLKLTDSFFFYPNFLTGKFYCPVSHLTPPIPSSLISDSHIPSVFCNVSSSTCPAKQRRSSPFPMKSRTKAFPFDTGSAVQYA